MLNLDTHILINAVGGLLTQAERQALAAQDWGISSIVYRFGLDHPPLSEALRRIKIWPITPEVCLKLRTLDFHADPADEIIAATSLAHNVPLVTRDEKIRDSKLVQFCP